MSLAGDEFGPLTIPNVISQTITRSIVMIFIMSKII